MASKTIEFGAIDQTAEPLCDKIAPTEPEISIGLAKYAPLYAKIQNRKLTQANFCLKFHSTIPYAHLPMPQWSLLPTGDLISDSYEIYEPSE
jgi:hypothetical protein